MVELRTIPVDRIRIPDVRVSSILDAEQKALLASTIKEVGVVQDPVVRDLGGGDYELIAGKSRLGELVNQGAKEIQAKIVQVDEKLALKMNVIENIARGNYDYISVAKAIRRMKELGASPEELEKTFPWKRRWIELIEELQDLPDDVVAAIQEKRLTPSHVQLALMMPTPAEAHSSLQTSYRLGWDTGTFRRYVENRVDEIERARQKAIERGTEPDVPPPNPEQLVSYKMCNVCGYKKPVGEVPLKFVCDSCALLVKYIVDQVGPSEKALEIVGSALLAYAGQAPQEELPPPPPTGGSSQP